MIKYRVHLTTTEREELIKIVGKGKSKATAIKKANVLLASEEHEGRRSETVVSEAYHCPIKTVERIRREFCERGMTIFEPQPRKTFSDKKINGTVKAHILAVSCLQPPAGQSRW